MDSSSAIWLVVNASSGSNSPEALEALERCCGNNGFAVQKIVRFPDENLPAPAALDAARVKRVAVYAGDGTINACIRALYGWSGAVMVLPGGTMNLLSRRLHGDAELETIVARIGAGATRAVRPLIVRSRHGDTFAGMLVGPGTAWNEVREAMREVDIAGMLQGTSQAFANTTGGSMVRCSEPRLGRPDGYPLLEITPGEWGMQIDAYHAEDAGDFVQQGWALLRRRFREGPHDRLGLIDRLCVEDTAGERIGLLLDGEPFEGSSREEFAVARCEVDLLATQHGI